MMRKFVLLSLLSFAAETVYSQAGAWGQCGGTGWTGATTCIAGYVCTYSNPWYSQCIPETGTTSSSTSTSKATTLSTSAKTSSSTSKATSSTKTSLATSTKTSASSTTAGACTAAFTPVTASAAFAGLNPGWNLGNTLDATPNEGSWNNPPVVPATFSAIAARGFKSIRIPVTWAYHFDTQSPSWTLNSTWMDRVETVVDQALATGVYVILNVHHDSWIWADPTVSGANLTAIEERFSRLWTQIGTRFRCKSSKLLFEALNEPVGSDQTAATELNKLNDLFLDAINKGGGNNPKRVVSLSGLGMDSVKTSQWFVRGTTYPSQPWGLQFHYYSPYDFIFGAWGKTIWGSDADKATLANDFALFNGNFSTIPAFVGEWDASTTNTETAARWKYFDYFIRTANKYKYSHVIWDNGLDHFDRTTNTWRDPIAIDILFSATAGTVNSLADSTTDPAATTQSSSAYLFHKVGDPVIAQSVPYLLNGNTLKSIKNAAGTTLATTSYSMSTAGSLTFTAAYLGGLYTASAAAGIKDTLTLTFSAGTPLTLQIVQYDTPVIPTTTYKVDTSADLTIPATYKGVPIVAAVKALKADGTYLADDWTVYLGPLQQARWTYGNWDYSSAGFIVKQSGLTTIQAAGQSVVLTVEFYPRSVGANAVNVTFTQ